MSLVSPPSSNGWTIPLNSCRYQPLDIGKQYKETQKRKKTLLSSNPIIILTLRKKQQAMNISASVLHGLDIGKKV
jgi:hypothetical protein